MYGGCVLSPHSLLASHSTLIYTSELILCSTILIHNLVYILRSFEEVGLSVFETC